MVRLPAELHDLRDPPLAQMGESSPTVMRRPSCTSLTLTRAERRSVSPSLPAAVTLIWVRKGRDGRLAGDFEDIAIVGDRFFLVEVYGVLLEFAEGQNGVLSRTGPTPRASNRCAKWRGWRTIRPPSRCSSSARRCGRKSQRQQVAVYSWSLADRTRGDTPRLVVPWSTLAQVTGGTGFNGSAVALTPRLYGRRRLSPDLSSSTPRSAQTARTAPRRFSDADPPSAGESWLLLDGTLLVASEGGKGEAVLARYSAREQRES